MTARVQSGVLAEVRPEPHGSRFPELYDEFWWQLHSHESNITLGRMLGCSRETVRTARRAMDVPPVERGRARGAITVAATSPARKSVEILLLARIQRERKRKTAATEGLLATRIRSAYEARAAGEINAYDDSLLDIASAAALIYEHRQKLRLAA